MVRKQARPRPKPPRFQPTFMRQWREYREMTLERAGEAVDMSHAQLGRIERGLQPYNQELLEALAELYKTTPASLIMHDPTDERAIWSLWDQAQEAEREDTTKYLEFRVKTRTGT
ncbi:helix-turn-helix domain-containing protein [uncultured Bradyrhizobium sp.]|uniref:helix-turn-helix domain-containing protein n=1 Tax=uncultured Bradyrhizobium sp. TaxID=199684 RepID=UPI0035CB610E